MKKRALLIVLALLLLLTACAPKTSEGAADYAALLTLLDDGGFQYSESASGSDSLLSVPRKALTVEDEIIGVYEYAASVDMEKDAACIHPDGCGISRSGSEVQISWISLPHFFKKGTLIIEYVGEDEQILAFLSDNFGAQFAGC